MSIIVKVERESVEEGASSTIGLFVFAALPRGGERVLINLGTGQLRPYLVEQVEHFPVGSPEGSEQSAVSIYVTDDPDRT
jgi:hypothetical protein